MSTKVRGILIVGLISLSAAALAAALMAATIVRPLRRLQRATEQVARGDFETRAVVDNYIDNALNVSQPGDEITVSALGGDGWATIHVADEGPGMPPDQLQHAFDRFWRAANVGHEGSGLGLAIVRQLAEASGGDVALANRAEGGLDASVRLRLA